MPRELPVVNEAVQGTRPRCPFYGFGYAMDFFLNTEGNQCGLTTDSYSPCSMEMNGEKPDWDACPVYNISENRQTINEVVYYTSVDANPDAPRLIPFRRWFKEVMGRDYP